MKRDWRWWVSSVVWLALILSSAMAVVAQEDTARHVNVLEIEGPVTPVMISYIDRGISTSEGDGAEALIIKLNTPGGQIDLMNEIVQLLLEANVPTVVYVSPRGAYAASAGTLITLGAHVAAMAPGTTIGAASPVGSEGEDLGETMETKGQGGPESAGAGPGGPPGRGCSRLGRVGHRGGQGRHRRGSAGDGRHRLCCRRPGRSDWSRWTASESR